MSARGEASLLPGTVFQARVERGAERGASSLLLRLVQGGAAAAIARAGLPDDGSSRAALVALLREGLAPDPRTLSRVRRAAARDAAAIARGERLQDEESALAARLEAKGIAASDERVAALSAESWGRGDGSADHRDGRREARPEIPAAEPASADAALLSAGIDVEKDFEAMIPADKASAVLGAFLRSLSERSGGDGGFLQLFNHAPGNDGSWIYVPFSFELDSVAFAGSFRLHLPCLRGGPGKIEARFEARCGDRRIPWSFDLDFGSPSRELRIESGNRDSANAAFGAMESLKAELARSGFSVVAHRPQSDAGVGGLDLDA